MSNEVEYQELIAFHPGSYVEEIVEDLNMTQAEFARRLGISSKTVSKIISGEENVSPKTATKLASLTGVSIQTWLNLQANYDAKVAEIEDRKSRDEQRVCRLIDFKYLKQNGFLPDKRYRVDEKIQALRKLLKVADLSQLLMFNAAVSYRRSHAVNEEKSIVNSNVMLELAMNQARDQATVAYDKRQLEKNLPLIKKFNLEKPEVFYPRLQEILLACGIVLVALPHLPGAGLNGATKKFRNGSVLLMITDRNKNSDTFWFSLIHELGHIYGEDFYSNYNDQEEYTAKEKKADQFAANFFIPVDALIKFKAQRRFTQKTVTAFAQRLGILPGIVVGRLQMDGVIGFNALNSLKTKYRVDLTPAKS